MTTFPVPTFITHAYPDYEFSMNNYLGDVNKFYAHRRHIEILTPKGKIGTCRMSNQLLLDAEISKPIKDLVLSRIKIAIARAEEGEDNA